MQKNVYNVKTEFIYFSTATFTISTLTFFTIFIFFYLLSNINLDDFVNLFILEILFINNLFNQYKLCHGIHIVSKVRSLYMFNKVHAQGFK